MACDDIDFLIRNIKSRAVDPFLLDKMPPMATVMCREAWEQIEHIADVGSGFSTYPAYEDHPDRTTRRENALRSIRRIYAEAGTVITNDL